MPFSFVTTQEFAGAAGEPNKKNGLALTQVKSLMGLNVQ